jgi:hypothetical protein
VRDQALVEQAIRVLLFFGHSVSMSVWLQNVHTYQAF